MNRYTTRFDIEKFMKRVEKSTLHDCWEWVGYIDKKGYGKFSTKVDGIKRQLPAHRVSFAIHIKVPDSELVIDHICKNRKCVNPSHLREVTIRDNVIENSDSISAINFKKLKCKNGHDLSEANTYSNRPDRVCKICNRANRKERYMRTGK